MKARISNYRRSRHSQKTNHFVLIAEGVDSRKKAEGLKGKSVVWKSSSGKEIKGTVAAAHGNNGAFRVIMSRGLPGQAIGSEVDLS